MTSSLLSYSQGLGEQSGAIQSLNANAISGLTDAYNLNLQEIGAEASAKETQGKEIETAGEGLLGFGIGAKAIYNKYKSWRKGRAEKNDEFEGEDAEGDDGGNLVDNITDNVENTISDATDGITNTLTNVGEQASNVVSNVGEQASNLVDNATNLVQEGASSAQDIISNITSNIGDLGQQAQRVVGNILNPDASTTETPLEPTTIETPSTELGTDTITTSEPSGFGGEVDPEATSNIELSNLGRDPFSMEQEMDTYTQQNRYYRTPESREAEQTQESKEDFPEIEPEDEREDFPEAPDDGAVGDGTADAEDIADTQDVSDVADITTDTTIEGANIPATAVETGVEVGAEVGAEEGIGGILDATGILAPLGIALQAIGLATAVGTTIGGIVESANAGDQQTKDEQTAYNQYQAQKAGLPSIAGKFAVPDSSSVSNLLARN